MEMKEFIKHFGELVAGAPPIDNCGVKSMELDDAHETVTILFQDGCQKEVNVSADNYTAAIYDIIEKGLWKK